MLVPLPPPGEESRKQRLSVAAARTAHHAPFRMVVEARLVEQLSHGAHRTGLRVRCGEHDELHAGKHRGAGAHRAGLERHVERAAGEAPATERLRGLAQRDELRWRGRILVQLARILTYADDRA